ncbi:UNVERIFIED_CONTAM: seed maturation protein [Sesamum latifolium]|uniref:Seed maturation protein n=1 Tax=Sesamum latifolium TaxID=2727402 RepID=A0AAW2VI46_9LAMI
MKETAANVAAAAKSGMEKTRATVQEKMERMTADSPQEKKRQLQQRQTDSTTQTSRNKTPFEQNAAAKEAGGSYSHSTTGDEGKPTGGHQMSALPGHGSGEPAGQVVEGTIKSHPIGKATGTGRPTTAHKPTWGLEPIRVMAPAVLIVVKKILMI